MLSSIAVNKYLARPFNNYDVYKQLTEPQLDALARKYGVPAAVWAKMADRKHQKIMTLIGIRTKRFAFWADTGMGKSFVTMVLASYFRDQNVLRKKLLILVPQRTNKDEWGFEFAKHAPDLRYALLPSDSAGKWTTLQADGLIAVETYAGLYAMLCRKVVNGKGRNELQPDRARIKQLLAQVDGLVMDESHSVKTKSALPFRLCRQIANHANVVLALSGTPHGRDPIDLWGQYFLLDGGETLGETQELFRSTFFAAKPGYWGGMEYTFLKRKQGLLNQILANRSIRFTAADADLPKLIAIRKTARLPEDAGVYYARAKAALLAAANYREMSNSFLRMRQISSGFVGFHDDDTGATAEFAFPECPKRELLLATLTAALPAKQVVFYEYTWSAMALRKELDRLRIGWQHLWSGTRDTEAALTAWKRDASFPVLLLQSQFGVGLNLQQASYCHFFESPVSPIIRKQCERRVHRQESQHSSVFVYDYITADTVDERILDLIKEGYDLMANIIDGRKRLNE